MRLNRVAAAVGLVLGGLGTWALLQPIGKPTVRVNDPVEDTELALPEWRRRLADRPPLAAWNLRRHHCDDAVIGAHRSE